MEISKNRFFLANASYVLDKPEFVPFGNAKSNPLGEFSIILAVFSVVREIKFKGDKNLSSPLTCRQMAHVGKKIKIESLFFFF
jgi:hypothetical protein